MADKIEFVGNLRRVDVKPGDRFVMSTDRPLSLQQCEFVQKQWRDFICDDGSKLLIIPPGCEIGVIRAEAEAG